MTTYIDVCGHLLDNLGGSTDAESERKCRIAAQHGYRELATLHRWNYYMGMGRFTTSAPYQTGTITYSNSTRQVALAAGTWPTWSARGSIRISNIPYPVNQRLSDTVLTLREQDNPGADVAAGASYQIFQEIYRLPTDFVAIDDVVKLNSGIMLTQVPAREWVRRQRVLHVPSEPRIFAIIGDPDYIGQMAMVLSPPPSTAYTASYLYQRRPQELAVLEYSTGTASCTVNMDALTGIGTSWTADMEGAVVRFAADGTDQDPPSGPTGRNPGIMNRMIIEVNSATSITLDAPVDRTLTAVKYAISSPVDVEEGAMLTALFRECERQIRFMTRPNRPNQIEEKAYEVAIERARENDCRDLGRKWAGMATSGTHWPRLRDFPVAT